MVAGLVALTAILRLPLLDLPFERDEGEYAYIAWRLAFGELPYLDWVDQKPPAIFWTYRLALSLPLEAVTAVHLVAAAFAAATAVTLYFLARRFTGDGWALSAAILLALLSADPAVQGAAANTELFMLLPLLLAQLAFLSGAAAERRRAAWILASGALTAVAMTFKQVAAFQIPLLVALWPLFAPATGRPLKATACFAATFAAGVAAVWIPVALFFLSQGALQAMVHHVVTHNLAYSSALPLAFRLEALVSALVSLLGSQALVWLAAAIGLLSLAREGRSATLAFLAGGLVAGALGAATSGYFFPHYFQQLLPPLAIAAALGAERCSRVRRLERLPRSLRAALLVGGLATLPAASLTPFLLTLSPEEASRRIYPGNPFPEMAALAQRLAESTEPGDRVFVFGAEPEILFHAQRASATRYIHLFPLYGPYGDASERQRDTAAEIAGVRPEAIVLVPNALFSLPGSDPWLTGWVESYVRDGYIADAFLVVDPSGGLEMRLGVDGDPATIPFGREAVAALYLRRAD